MIIGLLGFINSGKGTVSSYLIDNFHFRQESFASTVKDICATMFGWPRHLLEGDTLESRLWREVVDVWWAEKLVIPHFTPRFALQYIGTDVIRGHFNEDIWLLSMQNRIRKNPEQNIVISDVRFTNEIKFLQDQGGILVKINRGPSPVWYETALLANKGNSIANEIMIETYPSVHLSEWSWIGSKFDYEINNNTNLENLNNQIKDLLEIILK